MSPRSDSHREWLEKLPTSQMVYPSEIGHQIKYYFWRAYGPYHPTVRDGVIALNIVENRGRQPFLLGTIAPHLSLEEFVSHLVENGYAYHRIAWEDEGEVVSLRLVKDFVYQYHVRIFEDGEVRGHLEYTPESYPLLHLWDIGMEDRREEFCALIGEKLTACTSDDYSEYQWEFLPLLRRQLLRIQF